MIYGIGTDIVYVARIERALDRYGDRFASRILSPEEMEQYRDVYKKAHFLAKRFAAKEAVAKALGLGFRDGLRLTNIIVRNDARGKPVLGFAGYAAELIDRAGITSSQLSLSDEADYAIAFVTLERGVAQQ